MSKTPIEDCIKRYRNRFQVVLLAAARSRQISFGSDPKVNKIRKNEKETVIALRELSLGKLDIESTFRPLNNNDKNSS